MGYTYIARERVLALRRRKKKEESWIIGTTDATGAKCKIKCFGII